MGEFSGLTEVDFEIALTAFIASTVTAFPASELQEYSVVKILAISLLILTLIRRLAIINNLQKTSFLLEGTTHLLNAFTYISILYLYLKFSIWLSASEHFPLTVSKTFLVVVPLFTLLILTAQVLILRDALAGSEELLLSTSDEHRGTVFGGLLTAFAVYLGKKRQKIHGVTRQTKLGEFYERDVSDMDPDEVSRWLKSSLSAFTSLSLACLTLLAVAILGSVLFRISWGIGLLLWTDVILVAGLVDLWYSLYGVISVNERNKALYFLTILFTYLFVGKMLFEGW